MWGEVQDGETQSAPLQIQINLTLSERVSLTLNSTPDVGKDRSTLPSAS